MNLLFPAQCVKFSGKCYAILLNVEHNSGSRGSYSASVRQYGSPLKCGTNTAMNSVDVIYCFEGFHDSFEWH